MPLSENGSLETVKHDGSIKKIRIKKGAYGRGRWQAYT